MSDVPLAELIEPPPHLTHGLRLRRADLDDAEAVFDYRGRPGCQVYVSQTLSSVDEARDMLARRLANPDVMLWVIEQEGRVVGDVGGYRYRPETLGPEPGVWDFYLGYVLHPDVWGRGVATAVVGASIAALQDAGIRRVVARVLGPNEASIRVLLKNGFVIEGTERGAVLGRDGEWLDDHLFARWP